MGGGFLAQAACLCVYVRDRAYPPSEARQAGKTGSRRCWSGAAPGELPVCWECLTDSRGRENSWRQSQEPETWGSLQENLTFDFLKASGQSLTLSAISVQLAAECFLFNIVATFTRQTERFKTAVFAAFMPLLCHLSDKKVTNNVINQVSWSENKTSDSEM